MTVTQRRTLNRVRMTPHADNWQCDSAARDKQKLLNPDGDMRWPIRLAVCVFVVLALTAAIWAR